MGAASIIARRLADGHVQYGYSGNGGCYRVVGIRLLAWYQLPKDVEYLFELGETSLIGEPGSERGGFPPIRTHNLTGHAFWLTNTERKIFSRIAFIEYGYFYDLDNKWYYIIPGPFRIKMPLELIDRNLEDENSEYDFCTRVEDKILRYIFEEYIEKESAFKRFLDERKYDVEDVIKNISEDGLLSAMNLYHTYQEIFDYFDDWILIKTNTEASEIMDIVVRAKDDTHIETCYW